LERGLYKVFSKKGWICIGFEDLDEPATQFQMCESQDIRYVRQQLFNDFSLIWPGRAQMIN